MKLNHSPIYSSFTVSLPAPATLNQYRPDEMVGGRRCSSRHPRLDGLGESETTDSLMFMNLGVHISVSAE